jgi:hypothetical protein
MAGVAYGTVPFKEQIAFFRRKPNVLTESYLDVWGAQHDAAFMVAGANRDALLADLRDAVRKAIEDGATLEDFRRDFDRIVATQGWDYNGGRNWRSRVIYETNLRQSYNAGRWAQLQRLKKVRPWWRYRHNDAVEHPRPLHVAWDGMVLHCDDPWWLTHFPANGWGCKCYVEALSDRDLKRLGKIGPDKAPAINLQPVIVGTRSPGGPRTVMTPAGVDPGFGYAPGASLDGVPQRRGGPVTPPSLAGIVESSLQDALRKTTRLPAPEAAASAAQTLALPRAPDALQGGFARWSGAVDANDTHPAQYMLGALQQRIVAAAISRGVAAASAAIALPAEVWSAATAARITGWMTDLPAALAAPLAVLLDRAASTLRYVLPAARGRVLVVDIAIGAEGANIVSASEIVRIDTLRDALASGRLELLEGELAP